MAIPEFCNEVQRRPRRFFEGRFDMKFSVQAFNTGTCWVPGPEVYWMEAWNTLEELNVLIYLIRGNGHNLLINTGPPQDLGVLNKAWLDFFGFEQAQIVRSEDQLPQNILRSQGLTPDDISMVLVTPLQLYATANIPMFRNAMIAISRRGWIEDFQAPFYHLHVPRHLRVPSDVNQYLQNEGWEKLRLLADEEEVLPGIRVFWAGVHHRSSMAVSVDTERGKVIITDAFFKYGNIESGRYLGVMESMMEADSAWARIRREADLYASIYDPEVFKRYPNGILS
jgi:glyoxylase-like metal-dependent hydrolase (beta-lactamase superfamily II)